MSWIYLLIASMFEVGWPLGLKYFQSNESLGAWRYQYLAFAIISMGVSGYFLILAQRDIPIGTAYAVWTGIGAIGTFVLGIILFSDTASLMRAFGILMILGGVITLKLAH